MIQEKEKFPLKNWEIVSVNPSEKNWTWKDLFCFWGVCEFLATVFVILYIGMLFFLTNVVFGSPPPEIRALDLECPPP